MDSDSKNLHGPRLIRTFVRTSQPYDAYSFDKGVPLRDEYDILATRDTSIRELLLLLQKSLPDNLRNPRAIYSLRSIYVDMKAMYHKERDLGRFSLITKNYSDKFDDADNLDDARIYPGDYLSIHLQLPGQGQRRHPPPSSNPPPSAGSYPPQSAYVVISALHQSNATTDANRQTMAGLAEGSTFTRNFQPEQTL
ncbi:hypothetical protein E3P99_02254 [Wallemia hederae]|uniref:Uncharacterized protein n=1 Tax=Wallemia hederae TaxID=1540922 RepID=A0A4T0FNB8_9BASI|nr:hypothetical protein E3P99_02254 [Wallemia hederae]